MFAVNASASVSVKEHVSQLTEESHRLAGSAANEAAAGYLRQQLALAGVDTVLALGFDVVALADSAAEASLSWGEGLSVELHALRPNVVAPVTMDEPIVGPMVYVGRGGLDSFAGPAVAGAVVAMEYDSGEHWERAFARGAAAVVFLGSEQETHGSAKHAPVPMNLPRFYVAPGQAQELRQNRAEVVLDLARPPAASGFGDGENLVVLIPGTDPAGEAMVVTAAYDTFGVVPTRAPGTRRAANVAGLLRLAEMLTADPPKRDVWLLFQDAGAQRHRGARVFYDAVMMADDVHAQIAAAHADEAQRIDRALIELEESDENSRWLLLRLQATADAARADLDRQRQLLRRSAGVRDGSAAIDTLGEQVAAWDRVRRWLNQSNRWADAPAEDARVVAELRDRAAGMLTKRAQELATLRSRDVQRGTLRGTLSRGNEAMPRVVLHVDMDLSDAGPTWSAVTGDWTDRVYAMRAPRSEADAPGYHVRVLAALRQMAEREAGDRFSRLDGGPLESPVVGQSFVPGRYVNAGSVAGGHGIYHVALMTGHDARVRDGQPSDTVAAFDFENFTSQLDEAIAFFAEAADDPAMSIRSTITPMVVAQRKGWDGQRPTGALVTRRVTGGLSENRPAAGVAVALWPGEKGDGNAAWRALSRMAPADYLPFDLTRTNQHGRFEILGLRSDIASQVSVLAFDRDEVGRLSAVPTQSTLVHDIFSAIRVDLFAGQSYGLTWWGGGGRGYGQTSVLRASSDAAYRPNLSLAGRGGRQRFWVLADRAVEPGVKLFEAAGPVALGVEADNQTARGVAVARFAEPTAWATQTATDLWRLNEGRLEALRRRGVTAPDLEVLHATAGRGLNAVDDAPAMLHSAALSQVVYPRLRSTMDDLVYAIVALLLLTIPFSFAMERLVVGAAGVYGRIAGFVAVFFVTFGLLYATHPGFAIASTPVMIFLAFAIVLLSSMVIWVLVRRFQTELAQMQGRAAGRDGGGMRGLSAAINMGMSTMRRRPTRTILTATTVVMLTFTVLCFASVSREIGVRSAGLGPVTEAMPSRAVLVRKIDAGPMELGKIDLLSAVGADAGRWLESWWRVPTPRDDRPITVARLDDGRTARLGGVLGVDTGLLAAWPRWRSAFNAEASAIDLSLANEEIFLPTETMAVLELVVGDAVLVDGRRLIVGGGTDGRGLATLRQADGESWLPVDVAGEATLRSSQSSSSSATGPAAIRNVLRLSASQVAVASNAVVEQLGGGLRSVTQWVADDAEPGEVAAQVVAVTGSPVWVTGPNGAERLTLGGITRVSGVWRLVAPVLLGGLIIFGTLLGSISDRQKEIYTFSALGLGPRHVGMLFFAEAAVYAVVGGLGGQLLAQVVALGASWMSVWGWIRPVSINFASTQALFAIGVVMATVMVSAIYPAVRASKSANPGLARAWTMPTPEAAPRDHELKMTFPFTVSAYDLTGVVAFLAEHFRQHADAGLGPFAAAEVTVGRDQAARLMLTAEVALAPFDLGVTQQLSLTGVPSDIPGVDEIAVHLERRSGTKGDWVRANRVFIKALRRQFLVWRTLPAETVERYRLTTLETLGEVDDEASLAATVTGSGGAAYV